jgi:anti-sigma factor RsiW
MDKGDVEYLLSGYLDGTLSPEEQIHVEARLRVEPELRDRLEALRRVDALVRRWGEVRPEVDSEEFAARLRTRLAAERLPHRPSKLLRLYAPLAAAAAVLLLGVFWLLTPDQASRVTPIVFVRVHEPLHRETAEPSVVRVSFAREAGRRESTGSRVGAPRMVVSVGGVRPAKPDAVEDALLF